MYASNGEARSLVPLVHRISALASVPADGLVNVTAEALATPFVAVRFVKVPEVMILAATGTSAREA